MSFSYASHCVQPNACDSSFYIHRTLIDHGTCNANIKETLMKEEMKENKLCPSTFSIRRRRSQSLQGVPRGSVRLRLMHRWIGKLLIFQHDMPKNYSHQAYGC